LNKILGYEIRRLLFSKIYLALLAITLLYAYSVLSSQTILGEAYTAPFSKWSYASFLCSVVPFLLVSLLFFCTYVYSKKELAVRTLTLTTPLTDARYYLYKVTAIALAYLITALLVIGLSFGFYAWVFKFSNFADFLQPILLFVGAPSVFLLGLGMAVGGINAGLQYVLIALTFLLGVVGDGLGPFGLFNRLFVKQYPLQLTAGPDGEVPFLVPAGLVLSRWAWIALGVALLAMVCLKKRHSGRLVLAFCLLGATAACAAPGSTALQSAALPTGTQTASGPGLTMPAGFGLIPVSSGTGFSVRGSASVKANQAEVQVEIDTADLDSIQVGNKVTVRNAEKNIFGTGVVTGLPDSAAVQGSDTCRIDVTLDGAAGGATATPAPSPTTQTVSTGADGASSVTSFTSQMESGLPAVDADVEVEIRLPGKAGVLYVPNGAIFEGKDGKQYAWATEKAVTAATPQDLALVPVSTGATDGQRTEVLSGLQEGWTILVGY
jgi:hypothetical protein